MKKKKILKRIVAGLMAMLTIATSVPLAAAAEALDTRNGVAPRAEADNQESTVVINGGDTYSIYDRGPKTAMFQQDGSPRNVWAMYTQANNGETIRAYCANHTKGNPGGGKKYTVSNDKLSLEVAGVAAVTDSRITVDNFVNSYGDGNASLKAALKYDNDWGFFCASQAAIWTALGYTYIPENSKFSVGYNSSMSLGYAQRGRPLTPSNTTEAWVLLAAIKMLKYGKDFAGHWGSIGHTPYVGAAITYTPGSDHWDASKYRSGHINLGEDGIAKSGYFVEKQIAGKTYMVLPMAASSATFVRGNVIYLSAGNMPEGAFFMTEDGTKSQKDGSSGREALSLTQVKQNNELNKNGNNQAFGQTFLFCIPKETVEEMDASKQTLNTDLLISMRSDRYNAYLANPDDTSIQPVVLVEPGVFRNSARLNFSSDVSTDDTDKPEPEEPGRPDTPTDSEDFEFKIIKSDGHDGSPLEGATFEIRGIDNDYINNFTTNALGEIVVNGKELPNGSYEVREIGAPPGYTCDATDIKTFAWDNTRDVTLEFKNFHNPGITLYKFDGATKVPLQGATFQIKKDGQVLQEATTDANGKIELTDLPRGLYEFVEIGAPDGYILDPYPHEVFIDPTEKPADLMVRVDVPNYKKPSLRVVKEDKITGERLNGFTFDIYKDGALWMQIGAGDMVNGEKIFENIEPGTYRVVETGGPDNYNHDAPPQEIEIKAGENKKTCRTCRA